MRQPSRTKTGRTEAWSRANREAHSLAASLGWSHQQLSDFACANLGVSSMTSLSVAKINKLCGLLKDQGAAHKKKRKKRSPNGQRRRYREDKPDALPTPQQQNYLILLFRDVEELLGKEVNKPRFVKQVLKNDNRIWPQTRAEAAQVIEGLKGWIGQLKNLRSKA